jgi:hypothetical protein
MTTRDRRWSAHVTRTSHALTLDAGVFRKRSALAIARSLEVSAVRSRHRNGSPLQSAMSMLNFYINRGGKTLSPARRRILEHAKVDLRRLFGRTSA